MSTHNICFRGEIRKIFTGYPPLSRPMGRANFVGSIWEAEWLALLTSDLEVILGLNPARSRTQLMTVQHFIAQSFIQSFHHLDMTNNVERDVKHQTITIIKFVISTVLNAKSADLHSEN